MSNLTDLPFLKTHGKPTQSGTTLHFTVDDDLDLGVYYLRSLANIFRWAPDNLWGILAKKTVSSSTYPSLSQISKSNTCRLQMNGG